MNLYSKRTIKETLKKYNVKLSKKLGQNFLIDKSAAKKLIQAADFKKQDIVLEIGPGIGTLTQEIASEVKKIIAVEKDEKMCQILRETLKDFNNIEIINADILFYKPPTINYKLISNLPFYLTAVVIRKFLEEKKVPKEMILIVQKEVGQRITSKPPHMNLLAVSVQFYAESKIIDYISKKSFWPQPEVDAAIIKLSGCARGETRKVNPGRFFKIVKAGFSHPRKTILNNFKKELKLEKEEIQEWLAKNNINSSQRPESLSLQDWLNLTKTLK